MGAACESSNDNPNPNINQLPLGSKYDPALIKQKFSNYILNDNIIDTIGHKYKSDDPVFQTIHKEEKEILTKFYDEKKEEFKNSMYGYLKKQNLNFVNMLTKQIIDNERGRQIFAGKIKNEIEDIANDENKFKLNYLTIMIIGITGTGKSTIVNNILFDGKEIAKESRTIIGTVEKTKEYKNKKVPYLRLIDTRGFELDENFSVDNLAQHFTDFIIRQSKGDNIDKYVNCIWYCVNPDTYRVQSIEKDVVDNLTKTIKSFKIPVIMVLTQSVVDDNRKYIREAIRNLGFEDIVDILSKDKKVDNNYVRNKYGLDKLIDLTIKKCKQGFDGNMKNMMMTNLTKNVKMRLTKRNLNIRASIQNIMMRETYEKDLANQNFEKYINKIYSYNLAYFLDKSTMESESEKLIKNSEFNRHKNNFFAYCQQYENQFISKEILLKFAYHFLDIQAKKEIEKGKSVSMVNKRDLNAFIDTTGNFLTVNFDYFSKKIYTDFVIQNIFPYLSENFENELNNEVENLMYRNEIQAAIERCFNRKFSDFEKNARRYPPFPNIGNNFDVYNNDTIIEDGWMNDMTEISKISINSKGNTFFDNSETKFIY